MNHSPGESRDIGGIDYFDFLDMVTNCTDAEVAEFRTTLTPDWREMFDGMEATRMMALTALSKLPDQHVEHLRNLTRTRYMLGLHDLANVIQMLDGCRMEE